jgi:hypothetical protein
VTRIGERSYTTDRYTVILIRLKLFEFSKNLSLITFSLANFSRKKFPLGISVQVRSHDTYGRKVAISRKDSVQLFWHTGALVRISRRISRRNSVHIYNFGDTGGTNVANFYQ